MRISNKMDFSRLLATLLGRGKETPFHFSRPLRDAIVGIAWEIYENAFKHARSAIGVFSCGQHYPKLRVLKLTVVDFGVGIPSNVRSFKCSPSISASKALRWAFQRGTSTDPTCAGCGLGLDFLKEFVKLNQGKLEFFSNDGYAYIDSEVETFLIRQNYFEGTLVNITLQCDERYYCLSSEPLS